MRRRGFLRRSAMALAVQYETVSGFAADTFEAYGLDPRAIHPSEATERIPLAGGRKLWETVVPILEYDAERLAPITLHPVTLGITLPRHERANGTPVRWEGATGTGHVTLA